MNTELNKGWLDMIKGIGIDLIELARIKDSIKQNVRLTKRILTESEQSLLSAINGEQRKVEFIAGRFAAKEAFSKAAGTGIGKLSFRDIEIIPGESGAPQIKVDGFEKYELFISISHGKDYAVAQVIIEDQ